MSDRRFHAELLVHMAAAIKRLIGQLMYLILAQVVLMIFLLLFWLLFPQLLDNQGRILNGNPISRCFD